MPAIQNKLHTCHYAYTRDFHENIMYVNTTPNFVYLVFLDIFPRFTMPNSQGNVATYIHIIC